MPPRRPPCTQALMALVQTHSKGRGVAVGDTCEKKEPRLGGRRGGGWGKWGVGTASMTTREDRGEEEGFRGWHVTLLPLPSYCSGLIVNQYHLWQVF